MVIPQPNTSVTCHTTILPEELIGEDGKVAIVINTCLSYLDVTVPKLLVSLREAGTPMRNVHIVVGETPPFECRDIAYEDAYAHFVPYGNMDNNGLVWASSGTSAESALRGYDWIFYLHDTCLVKPSFWNLAVVAADMHAGYDAARIQPGSSMCIGLYSLPALRTPHMLDQIHRITNLDCTPTKVYDIKSICEDQVFNLLGRVGVLNNHQTHLDLDLPNPYSTKVVRIQEVYDNPGVIKLKANWMHQTWVMDP